MWDLSAIETRIGTHGGGHGGAGASGKKLDAARMPDEEEDKT